ncbi:MAG: protein kinase [Myxococcales bacterium]|nr:protein kinase [Myxococcales bacterium]
MADVAAEERVGETIAGKYVLERLLGSGGMGAVYAAEHHFTKRRVAVKLMHPSFARSTQAAERFVREARAPSTIGHGGIVEVLDGGYDTDGSLYLVLELLEGETLGDRLDRGPLPPAELGALSVPLLEALEAAHQAGFVHRDIKPDNIFLPSGDGVKHRVKLLDFGVAGLLNDGESNPNLTRQGAVLGTPLYMSPEQARGQRVDARSDIWAVGAVMYRALTGRPPFDGDSVQALIISIATEEHSPLSTVRPDLPARLVTIVERAMKKDLERRWQSAGLMAEALRSALTPTRGVPRPAAAVMASPAPPPEPAGTPPWILAAGLLAMLAVGAAGWAAFARRAAPGSEVAVAQAAMNGAAEAAVGAAPPLAEAAEAAGSAGSEPRAAAATSEKNLAEGELQAPTAEPELPERIGGDLFAPILNAHQGQLQQCYQDVVASTLLEQPDAPAPQAVRLDVQLSASPAGRVTGVTIAGEGSPELKRCVRRVAEAFRLPEARGRSELRFPVVFKPVLIQP